MFESKDQQKYLFANKPEIAKEFAEKTPKKAYKKLPDKVGKRVDPSAEHLRDQSGLMKISKQYRRKK